VHTFIPLNSIKLFGLRVELLPDLLCTLEIYIWLHRLQDIWDQNVNNIYIQHTPRTKPRLELTYILRLELLLLHFALVIGDAKCTVVTRICVSVCLSAAVCPHYCTDPDATWGRGRGCPLVVHYWADLQSGYGLHCYGNITRTLVTSLRQSRDMTT